MVFVNSLHAIVAWWRRLRGGTRAVAHGQVEPARPARVLDLVAAGAKVQYTTDRHYDHAKAVSGKQASGKRAAVARRLAAEAARPAETHGPRTVPFGKRGARP